VYPCLGDGSLSSVILCYVFYFDFCVFVEVHFPDLWTCLCKSGLFCFFLHGGSIVWNVLRFCGDFIKCAGWVVTLLILYRFDLSLCLLLWEMGHVSFLFNRCLNTRHF
jgi:hypothetical protein